MSRERDHLQNLDVPAYMAFPDGVFDYSCAACTALCCRGQGFGGSLKREMPVLLSTYPALASAVVSRRGSFISFGTPAGRCFFLDGDNYCRIEKDHGKSLKPGVCSLFPFNNLTRIGNVVALSPHFMCPIRLQVPARAGQVEGTHSVVEASARASGLLDAEHANGYITALVLHPAMNAESVLKREISFRDACSRSLLSRSFDDLLQEQAAEPESLALSTKRAAMIMGFEVSTSPRDRDHIDDLLLALAPSHRLSLLHLSSEAILRALAIGGIVLRQMISLSKIELTVQGAHSLLSNSGPMVRLLARGDETIGLAKNANPKSPPFGDPGMSFAAFSALRKIAAGSGVLGALEASIGSEMPRADRAALLSQLGSVLERTRLRRAATPAYKEQMSIV